MSKHAGSRPVGGRSTRWPHLAGAAAEHLVARHLEERGCRIVARRFRCAGGEVDLVARDGDVTAFVEVKARRSTRFGGPLEAVTRRKQRRIIAAARGFLRQQGRAPGPCRFDVACVSVGGGRARVVWVRDAFRG